MAMDWRVEVDKMLVEFDRQATLSLSNIRTALKSTGLSFNPKFRQYFLEAILKRLENTYDQFEIRSRLEEEMFSQASSSTSGAARNTRAAIKSTHIKSEMEIENRKIIEIDDSSDEATMGRGRDSNALCRNGTATLTLPVHSSNATEQRKGGRLKENKNSSTKKANDVKQLCTTIRGFPMTATKAIDGGKCVGFNAIQNVVNASAGNTSDSAANRIRTRSLMAVESQNGTLNDGNRNGGVNNVSVVVSGTSKNRQRTLNACLVTKDTQNNKNKVVKSGSRRIGEPSSHNKLSLHMENLNAHMQTQAGKKSYRCERCGKEYKRAQYLRKHASTHTDVYLFYCKGCFSSFSLKAEKEAHEKVCSARRYECHLCKSRVHYKVADLKRHMRKHTGEKPFRCEICLKRFNYKSVLQWHLDNVHTKIKL